MAGDKEQFLNKPGAQRLVENMRADVRELFGSRSHWLAGTQLTESDGLVYGDVEGCGPGDLYLNIDTGDVFYRNEIEWTHQGNIRGGGGGGVVIGIDVEVTSKPADGVAYKDGETVTFGVTVSNRSLFVVYDVDVKSATEGIALVGDTHIGEFRPGNTVSLTASRRITQADYGDKALRLTVTAGNELSKVSASSPFVPIVERKVGLSATKAITSTGTGDRGEYYTYDTVKFGIRLQNTGNVDLHNIMVTETLEGCSVVSGTGYTMQGGAAKIATLAPSSVVTVEAAYVVAEADAGKSGIVNTAAIVCDETTTTATAPGFDVNAEVRSLTVAKAITSTGSGAGGAYQVGEVIEYGITVSNPGAKVYEGVTVTEQTAGASIVAGTGYSVSSGVARLNPVGQGANVVVKAQYPIKESDLGNKDIVNSARMQWQELIMDATSGKAAAEDVRKALGVAMTITNTGTGTGGAFTVGDTVQFKATVSNTGNVQLTGVTVTSSL